MPHLTNPFGSRLFCARLERIIAPGETVEITEAEATDLEDGSVFRVHRPAERETVTRGSKRVEVTRAPRREKRA